jgi:hypothetical protein
MTTAWKGRLWLLALSALLAGCPDSAEREKLRAEIQRRQAAERRMVARNRELEASVRELRLALEARAPEETGSAKSLTDKDIQIRSLEEELALLTEELSEARAYRAPTVSSDPGDVTRDFLSAVIRGDGEDIEQLVDWAGMARETTRRDEGEGTFDRWSDEKRKKVTAEVRKRFMDEFSGRGAGRSIVLDRVEQSSSGALRQGLVRVDLGDAPEAGSPRWSILLRRTREKWRIVGVLQETLVLPEDGREGEGTGEGSEEGDEGR